MRTLCWLMMVCGVLAGSLAVGVDIGSDKKVIEWGWDEPDTAYLRKNISEMEAKAPFDGTVFRIGTSTQDGPRYLSHENWGKRRFTEEEIKGAIEDLRVTKFVRFSDNFIRLNVTPGDVDFFDAEFDSVIENARLAAHVGAAAKGFVKGFMFDTEMYKRPVFTYSAQRYAAQKTFVEYAAKASERGRQFVDALQGELPDPVIMITFAYSVSGDVSKEQMAKGGFGLLPAFIDGMLTGMKGKTTIVDAYESSYIYRDEAEFLKGRDIVYNKVKRLSGLPELYAQRMKIGFGLYMDTAWNSVGWSAEDPEKNQFSPKEFEYAVHRALKYADRYVWVYSEQPNWWTGDKLAPAYIGAIRNARNDHEPSWKTMRKLPSATPGLQPSSALQKEGEDATFAPLWAKYDAVMDLPKEWLFCPDPEEKGEGEKRFANEVDLSAWKPIQIGKFWDEQGYTNLIGSGWYRCTVNLPEEVKGKRLLISVGAADEVATVYVNGQVAGKFGVLGFTWQDRFEIDITKQIRPGEKNSIVIRVENSMGQGGLWKGIKLIAAKPEA